MRTIHRLERWREDGLITGAQYDAVRMLVLKERFSLFLELNAFLYIGVLALAGGIAWTAATYSDRLGDSVILLTLSCAFAVCVYYCWSRSHPYSAGEIESPNIAFDYVLYAGCLILGVELAYIENRFQLLGTAWDHYLLFSAAVFFLFAYRFDNRLVLSLGLSSLAGWFGLRFTRFGLLTADSVRLYALAYGALITGAGYWLWQRGIKKHFLETYLHVAANVTFVALVTGGRLYVFFLLVLCAVTGWLGIRFKRFSFVAYAVGYGYIGLSSQIIPRLGGLLPSFAYLAVTGTIIIIYMVRLARRAAPEA
jgi:hypothetical protein